MEGFRRSLKQLSESRCGFAPSAAWPLDLSWTPARHPSFPSKIWALTRQEAMRSAKRYVMCLIQCTNSPSCLLQLSEQAHKAAVLILYGGHNSVASLLVALLSLCRVENWKCKQACTITLQAFGTFGNRYAERVFKHYFVKINEMSEFITVNKEQLCSLLGELAFTADNQSSHNGPGSSGSLYELASSEGKAGKPVKLKQKHQSWNP